MRSSKTTTTAADQQLVLADGVVLTSRFWSPAGTGPWPTLLMRQPYGRAIASTVTAVHPQWWADQGFLVVVQDVRGQGDSGGVFRGFSQEANDTAATLEWVRSLPECNGRIGLYGFSYQGLTQLVAAPGTPPPDCLAPAMTGLHERDHWSCEGGAHWWHLGLGWGLQLAAQQARRRGDASTWEEIRRCLEENRYCRDGLALLRRHDPNSMVLGWLERDPQQHSAWTCHEPPDGWLRQPMLLLGGWWDPHLRGILDLHQRSLAAGGQPDLHIGPATHLNWWPEAQQLQLSFFKRHLCPDAPPSSGHDPQPKTSRVKLWDQRLETWSNVAPDRSAGGRWRLSGTSLACFDPGDGQLSPISLPPSPNESRGEVVIVHDPWRAAPAIGGHLSPSPGPCDRAATDARSDVATFTSPPLGEAVLLRGVPGLTLLAHADQPGFDLCVALSVCRAGSTTVQQLSTGVRRILGDHALENQRREVHLQALEAHLQPGDRLRLSIAAACWPAIAVNSGDPSVPPGPASSACRVTTLYLAMHQAELRFEPLITAPET